MRTLLFMATRTQVGSIIAALLVSTAAFASGQSYRVALSIAEETGGLFQSAFASSLRALKDVEVVTADEHPDLLFTIVVLCDPEKECKPATSYAIAIQLAEPLTPSSARTFMSMILSTSGVGKKLSARESDSLGTLLFQDLGTYEYPEGLWTMRWGRNVYRRAVDEFVAQFDSKCLERKRLLRRMSERQAAGDTVAERALFVRWVDKEGQEKWMC